MRSRVAALAACLIMSGCTPRSPLGTSALSPPSTPAAPAPSASATAAAGISRSWVPVPGLSGDHMWERGLNDVTAAGPERAWAIGHTGWEDSETTVLRTWDGKRWKAVPIEGGLGGLASVDSDGPRNAWIVSGGFHESMAQHWDGYTWRPHRLPTYGLDLAVDGRRVVVISKNTVLTWNGAAFVTEKALGGEEVNLTAVDSGAGHTWIAGRRGQDAGRPVIWHGHDGGYEETTLPEGELNAILQIAPDDVWVVGCVGRDGNGGERPLALHWNGRRWERPTIPSWRGELQSVTAFGPDDVWFAGLDRDGPGAISVLHWDGRSWTTEVPPPGGEGQQAVIERIPGTSRLWLTVNVAKGDSQSIVTYRRE
ncbi:hypothetical protein ACLQ2R_30140 [Streptosporangium sp. DT93]|uniref:hypothetical protein n=1 Tax=Streptosporangium sp. DT93 TaxID=3393428 RepID=UPI003CEE7AA3